MAGNLFEIKENLFDSGLLASKVGEVILPSTFLAVEDDIAKLARDENYDLIYLSSNKYLELKKFRHMGTLISLETDIDAFQKKLINLPDKYILKDFSSNKWHLIKKSIPNLWASRFSRDENISSKSYQDHKLKLIKHYYNKFPTIFKIAESRGELDAFLLSYLSDEDLIYYEGFITPKFRTGLLGASLLKHTVAEGKIRGAKRVKTKLYSDNIRFLKTYMGLGFKEIERKYYFHFWP